MTTHLGEFEQLVLLALLRLGEAGYGVTVRQELRQRGRRSVSLGTVYKTLLRLEAKSLVTAHMGEPTPERGGRRKKHYAVTAAGRRALEHSLAALRRLSHGRDRVGGTLNPARWLGWLLPAEEREFVLGDLEEAYPGRPMRFTGSCCERSWHFDSHGLHRFTSHRSPLTGRISPWALCSRTFATACASYGAAPASARWPCSRWRSGSGPRPRCSR